MVGLDCHDLVQRIRKLPLEERRKVILESAPSFRRRPKRLRALITSPVEGNAWHVDHIKRVVDGGGECGAENLRTLCVLCHSDVTYENNRQRKKQRIRKQQVRKQTLFFRSTTIQMKNPVRCTPREPPRHETL